LRKFFFSHAFHLGSTPTNREAQIMARRVSLLSILVAGGLQDLGPVFLLLPSTHPEVVEFALWNIWDILGC
jgi:hypothetical protein